LAMFPLQSSKQNQDKLIYVVGKSGDYFTEENTGKAHKDAMTSNTTVSTVIVLSHWSDAHLLRKTDTSFGVPMIAVG